MKRRERRYCFVLGAGASIASGIPSGKALAEQWLRELYERQCPAPLPGNNPTSLEEWCRADPNHANSLGNYASFLTDIRKDQDRAQEMYERAIHADPDDANSLGNYAGVSLALGDDAKGLPMLERAFVLNAPDTQRNDLGVELWFYAFAHGRESDRAEALTKLKELIVRDEIRSPGWDLSRNVRRAIETGHPDADWIQKLAQVINGDVDPTVLDGWYAWATG